MDIRHFLITILAGVVGTVAMTLVMYLYSYSSNQFTKVIHVLGKMLIGERNYFTPSKNALIVGTLAHFGVGLLFSFAYFLLWNWGIFRINLQDSILIGVASGILAIMVWKCYLSFHSHPPKFSELHFFIALFISHIFFGIVTVKFISSNHRQSRALVSAPGASQAFTMKSFKIILPLFAGLMILISSCNNQTLKIFKSSSARTQYQNTLKTSGIAATKIGMEWQSSASEAILAASELEVPFAIQGSFRSKSIEARAWSIQLEQGASVNILVHWQASDSSELIVDLLEGPEWKELESYSTKTDSLKFEADKTGQYLLRIQPELLGEGNFQVKINGTSTYTVFPVQGKNSVAIQSVWGDVRDGGKRSHEGVDIFATRGTPVLAPVEGVVTAVRDRGLGGKQVWLRDGDRNWNLYFAHLDSQLVSNLQRVNPGDTLGLVGNTGNARTTAPHLHFGIYQSGAINPFPAIETEFVLASQLQEQDLPQLMEVNTSQANMRTQPSTKSEVISQLKANTPVFILAATSDWFQVETVEGVTGFLYQNLLSPVNPLALEEKEAFAQTNAISSTDSLQVDLRDFSKIGTLENGLQLIVDTDGNILYLPTFDGN